MSIEFGSDEGAEEARRREAIATISEARAADFPAVESALAKFKGAIEYTTNRPRSTADGQGRVRAAGELYQRADVAFAASMKARSFGASDARRG